MTEPAKQIAPGELLYRQVRPFSESDQGWFRRGGPRPVPEQYLRPTPSDLTGLSMLRASERHHLWCSRRFVSESGDDGRAYHLAVVEVSDLHKLGLTACESPDACFDRRHGTRAHVEIPQISHTRKLDAATKGEVKVLQRALAGAFLIELIAPGEIPQHGLTPPESDLAFVEQLRQRIQAARTGRPAA